MLNYNLEVGKKPMFFWLALFLILFFLVASVLCSASSDNPSVHSYYPLTEGLSWTYHWRLRPQKLTGEMIIENMKRRKLEGQIVTPQKQRQIAEVMGTEQKQISLSFIVKKTDGVYEAADQGPDEFEPDVHESPLPLLKAPVQVGTQWRKGEATFQVRGGMMTAEKKVSIPRNYKIVEKGLTVTVPAGTYKNCIKVVGKGTKSFEYEDYGTKTGEARYKVNIWYAPDMGMVKISEKLSGEGVTENHEFMAQLEKFDRPTEAGELPVANAGPDKEISNKEGKEEVSITLDGSRSEAPGGKIVNYRWMANGKQIASGVKPKITLTPGSHKIRLKITDDEGFEDSDEVVIRVQKTVITVCPNCDFQSIQKAIDAVGTKGTVKIKSGNYKENLKIDKDLKLMGENKSNVKLEGRKKGYPIILISSPDGQETRVKIKELTMAGAKGNDCANKEKGICPRGVSILGESKVIIDNCLIKRIKNRSGVYSGEGSDVSVINSTISQSLGGIHGEDSTVSIESSKLIDNTQGGVYFWDTTGEISKTTIKGSKAKGVYTGESGVTVAGTSQALITDSIISENGTGIAFAGKSLELTDSTITKSEDYGITVNESSSTVPVQPYHATILSNIISQNKVSGILLYKPAHATIKGNVIFNNGEYGVTSFLNKCGSNTDNSFQGEIEGKNNLIHSNPEGDVCPKKFDFLVSSKQKNVPQKSQLVNQLSSLKSTILKKIESEVSTTAQTFTSVKKYWRSKRWADIAAAPLSVIQETLSLLSKAASLSSLSGNVNSTISQSEAAYEVLSTAMMVQDLKKAGTKLHYGLDGPTYVSSIEKMLNAADETTLPPSDFSEKYYQHTIENYLNGTNGNSPLVIPRQFVGNMDAKQVSFVYGAVELKIRIASIFSDLINRIKESELPEDFPLKEIVSKLEKLENQIIKSRRENIQIDYLSESLKDRKAQLGAIGQLSDVFNQVSGMLDKKLEIRQRVEVLKTMEAAENAALLYSITYEIPGGEAIKVAQQGTVLSEIVVESYQGTFKQDIEEEFYLLPQEMVLSLPTEFSNLWVLALDTNQYIKSKLTGTFTENNSTNSVRGSDKVVVYFFWGKGCPHCEKQKPFLEKLENKYPELEVKMYEVYNNQENLKLFQQVAESYGIQARGVPTTFIGDFEPIVGYESDSTTGKQIEDKVQYCIENGCPNPDAKLNAEG